VQRFIYSNVNRVSHGVSSMRSNHTYLNYTYLRIVITAITLILLLALTPLTHTTATTEPQVEWEKTFGGGGIDLGFSVQQTRDGGYIIVGYTTSYGAGREDVYLIKVDANGNIRWSKTFGGGGIDLGFSVQQTSDGGYIIVGATTSYGAGSYDVYLIKVDANGNIRWNKTFGGREDDWGYSVQQTRDGGYIIVGGTKSYGAGGYDVYLIKVDANGNIRWNKTFGGARDDWGYSVQQTSDGGYIIVGATTSYGAGGYDVYLIKVDANGNMQWSKTFGGGGSDLGYSVQQTSDGGYIIVGYTTSYGAGGGDVYLIKVDANGNIRWNKTFGGKDSDWGHSVQQTRDGGYIIVGETMSYGAGGADVYLIKVDANGNIRWSKTFGGARDDRGYSVQQTSDGGYIIVGYTTSYGAGSYDVYLIKLGLGTITTITITTETVTTTVTTTVVSPTTTTYTTTARETTTITQTVPTFYTITKTETLTTTITSPYTTTITQTIPATITTTLHKTETQTLTTTATMPIYIPTATTTTIERPLFSEETVALGISIAIVTVSTLIGLRLRRR
jgi:hypothetical protein